MNTAKVKLVREATRPWRDWHTSHVTMALPFYRNLTSGRIHRVRSGSLHQHPKAWNDQSPDGTAHISLHLWCGGSGSLGSYRRREQPKGELLAAAPERAVFCATCEGRAIGAGMDGTRVINGRRVVFSPRI